jgi:hypothetical protein
MDKVIIMHAKDKKCMKNFIQNSERAIWSESSKMMKYYAQCGYGLVLCGSGQGPMAVHCEQVDGLINGKEFLDWLRDC